MLLWGQHKAVRTMIVLALPFMNLLKEEEIKNEFEQKSSKNRGSTVYTCSRYGGNRSYFIRSYQTAPDYLIKGSDQVILGAFMELILVATAIGTATTMFPFLRKYNETIALWHVCFRFLEAVIITAGVISVLSLLTLSREFVAAGAPDTASFQASGTLLKAVL